MLERDDEYYYYEEAFNGKKDEYIFIGHRYDLENYMIDVIDNAEKSAYFGNIFCPEQKGKWSYEKNQSWMLGGIHAQRKFLLESDLQHYIEAVDNKFYQIINLASKGYKVRASSIVEITEKSRLGCVNNIGVTIDELRWLYNSGYRFEAGDGLKTKALPPEKPPAITQLKSYAGLRGRDCREDLVEEILEIREMLRDINNQRMRSNIKVSPVMTSNLLSSYDQKLTLPLPKQENAKFERIEFSNAITPTLAIEKLIQQTKNLEAKEISQTTKDVKEDPKAKLKPKVTVFFKKTLEVTKRLNNKSNQTNNNKRTPN